MATEQEQMVLKAMTIIEKEKKNFRNRDIVAHTGLSKQAINYYLTKWEKAGYIGKDPVRYAEWYLIDLPSLLESMMSSSTYDLRHGQPSARFILKESWRTLTVLSDCYAALKSLGVPGKELEGLRNVVNNNLLSVIDELRVELGYLHTKGYGQKPAKGIANKYLARTLLDNYIDKEHIMELINAKEAELPVANAEESSEPAKKKLDDAGWINRISLMKIPDLDKLLQGTNEDTIKKLYSKCDELELIYDEAGESTKLENVKRARYRLDNFVQYGSAE